MPRDPGERMPQRVVPQPGHREASLVDELGLARDLDEHRVEDVADLAVDVVAEGAQADADLRRGDAGATRAARRVSTRSRDECAHAIVDLFDGGGDGLQDGVAEEADGTFRHCAPISAPRSSGQAFDDEGGEVACRVPRRGLEFVAVRSTDAGGELRVVRDPHDLAHAGAEVRLDLVELDEVGALGRQVEHDDGVAHELAVAVGLEPGERLGGEPRLVDAAARDDRRASRPAAASRA